MLPPQELCSDLSLPIVNKIEVFIIDVEEYPKLLKYGNKFYWEKDNEVIIQKTIRHRHYRWIVSRIILGCVEDNGLDAEHKDGDRLNNRKSNLRWATQSQNNANKFKYKGIHASKYKGVFWHKQNLKWYVKCKQIYIGQFESEILAALAYNEAALKYFGEYALLNKIEEAK